MRKVIIIEARMTSSRLPGKVLRPLAGIPALEQMIGRVKRSSLVDEVTIATTLNTEDDPICRLCERLGVRYFRGSEHDVLDRVLGASKLFKADIIIDLTSDCPLLDSICIDEAIEAFETSNCEYLYNRLSKGLPDGLDVQVVRRDTLENVSVATQDPVDRVHVTWYIRRNPTKFKIGNYLLKSGDGRYAPEIALTLDEEADLIVLDTIFKRFYELGMSNTFSSEAAIAMFKEDKTLMERIVDVHRKTPEEG